MRCVLLAIAFILLVAGSTLADTLRVSGGPDPRLGYFASLIKRYFGAQLQALNLADRVQIRLAQPAQ
ncbi:MAG: hypothetical protein J0H82_01245 [Alphaproteobacteria bacterium]|jgi:hypothetical protein|nr:hypothetical protein [Alphaproteobacteria bacterium]